MNWNNVNLKDSFERSQNILDGYSFDTLLLEISTNLVTMDEQTISRYFEKQLREKIDIARSVFNSNLKNIVADAIEYQNLDEEPSKPTHEEWQKAMNSIKDNKGQPQEIETKGEYYLDYFREVLPPLMFGANHSLCSEPYSHNSQGKGQYTGIYKKQDKFYAVIATKEEFINLIKS
jgi:hypothetical protein